MQAQKVSTSPTLSAQDAIAKARQGDISALQHLMESPLESRAVKVRVKRRDSSLAISLMGKDAPSKKGYLDYVTQGLRKLGLEDVETVRVSGYQMGKFNPLWQEEVDLYPRRARRGQARKGQPRNLNGQQVSKEETARQSAIAQRINNPERRITQPVSSHPMHSNPMHSSPTRSSPTRSTQRPSSSRPSVQQTAVARSGTRSGTRSGQTVRPSRGGSSRSTHSTARKAKKGNVFVLGLSLLLMAVSLLGLVGFGLLMRNATDNPVPSSADATVTPSEPAERSAPATLEAGS